MTVVGTPESLRIPLGEAVSLVRGISDRVFPRERLTGPRNILASASFATLQHTFEITCPEQIGPGFDGFQRTGMLLEAAFVPQRTAWLVRMLDLSLGPDTSKRIFPFLNSPGSRDYDLSDGHQIWRDRFYRELNSFDTRCKSVLRHDLNNMMMTLMFRPELEIMNIEKAQGAQGAQTPDPSLPFWKAIMAKSKEVNDEVVISSGEISFPQFLSNMSEKVRALETQMTGLRMTLDSEPVTSVVSQFDRLAGTIGLFGTFGIEELLVLSGQPDPAIDLFLEHGNKKATLTDILGRQNRLTVDLGGTNFVSLWKQALLVYADRDPGFKTAGSARGLLSALQRFINLPQSGI